MLPEQIWDYADLPSEGMYFGRSAGSAQPLVWAHAEYLKLLRSVADGRVFDRISVVEKRYAVARDKRTFRSHLAIYQVSRPITVVVQGSSLRIMDANRFTVTYTFDQWATKGEVEARMVGRMGCFVDIPIGLKRTGAIVFTLYWPEENRWLGHNCTVEIHAENPMQTSAADKPRT
jgi:glucoamylase